MAVLGRWSATTTTLSPTTTWASPNGLFTTQDRNDGSAYSFTTTNSRVTLPSSDLADGYLVFAFFEYEDTSNGRHNPQARIVQASGTGNFVGQYSTGFNRDSSEDRSYARCWGFIDNPSAGATLGFQWRRDSDAPTGGTVRSVFEVVALYYSNVGVYSSNSTTSSGTTTPVQIGGFSAVTESDTSAIELISNEVSLKGDNKRYLCLGGAYWQNIGAARTQRIVGFRVDGTADTEAYAYSYGRNSANGDVGEMFTTIVETSTADRTIDLFSYRGDAIGAFPNFGADAIGNTTGTSPQHSMVVIELNDDTEVFKSGNASQQSLQTAGTMVTIDVTPSSGLEFNDSNSFTRASDSGMNIEQDMDVMLGANIFGGYTAGTAQRATCYAEFTVNGTRQSYTANGNYARGDQGNQDCFGWSANMLSTIAVSTGEDVGVDAGKIAGGETGPVAVLNGYAGFWGINLDTLEADDGGTPQDVPIGILSDTENVLSLGVDTSNDIAIGLLSDTENLLSFSVDALESAVLPITYNPKSGWAVVEIASAVKTANSVFRNVAGSIPDTSQVLYPTAGGFSVGSTGLVSNAPSNSVGLSWWNATDGIWRTLQYEPNLGLIVDDEDLLPFTVAGAQQAELSIDYNPKSGYAVIEIASAVKTQGSVFENFVGTIQDTSQVYYPTANNTSVSSTGILTTDSTSNIDMHFWDASDGNWKQFTVISSNDQSVTIGILEDTENTIAFALSTSSDLEIGLLSDSEALLGFGVTTSGTIAIDILQDNDQLIGFTTTGDNTIEIGLLSDTENLISFTALQDQIVSIGVLTDDVDLLPLVASSVATVDIGILSDSEELIGFSTTGTNTVEIGLISDNDQLISFTPQVETNVELGLITDQENIISFAQFTDTTILLDVITDQENINSFIATQDQTVTFGLITDSDELIGFDFTTEVNIAVGILSDIDEQIGFTFTTSLDLSIGLLTDAETLLSIVPPDYDILTYAGAFMIDKTPFIGISDDINTINVIDITEIIKVREI